MFLFIRLVFSINVLLYSIQQERHTSEKMKQHCLWGETVSDSNLVCDQGFFTLHLLPTKTAKQKKLLSKYIKYEHVTMLKVLRWGVGFSQLIPLIQYKNNRSKWKEEQQMKMTMYYVHKKVCSLFFNCCRMLRSCITCNTMTAINVH